MEAKTKLENMKGKTFLYTKDKKNHTIHSFRFHGDEFTMVTNLEWFTKNINELSLFLEMFLEVDTTNQVQEQIHSAVVVASTNTALKDLSNILMDNIKKIQTDPKYINQAKAINNNINTMMNMVKLELQIKKVIK